MIEFLDLRKVKIFKVKSFLNYIKNLIVFQIIFNILFNSFQVFLPFTI